MIYAFIVSFVLFFSSAIFSGPCFSKDQVSRKSLIKVYSSDLQQQVIALAFQAELARERFQERERCLKRRSAPRANSISPKNFVIPCNIQGRIGKEGELVNVVETYK